MVKFSEDPGQSGRSLPTLLLLTAVGLSALLFEGLGAPCVQTLPSRTAVFVLFLVCHFFVPHFFFDDLIIPKGRQFVNTFFKKNGG